VILLWLASNRAWTNAAVLHVSLKQAIEAGGNVRKGEQAIPKSMEHFDRALPSRERRRGTRVEGAALPTSDARRLNRAAIEVL
jgi:antirestriction protein ArdC